MNNCFFAFLLMLILARKTRGEKSSAVESGGLYATTKEHKSYP